MAARKSSCNCGQLSITYDGPDPARISLCQCYECSGGLAPCSARSLDSRSRRRYLAGSPWGLEGDSSTPVLVQEARRLRACAVGEAGSAA